MDTMCYCVSKESDTPQVSEWDDAIDLIEADELYLFHTSNPFCPVSESLWGFVSVVDSGGILLEHGSVNLHDFVLWFRLPLCYSHCRLATRAELRDYMFALGLSFGKSVK